MKRPNPAPVSSRRKQRGFSEESTKKFFDLWWNAHLFDDRWSTLSTPQKAMFLMAGVLQITLLVFAIAFVDLGIVQPVVDNLPPNILLQVKDYIAPQTPHRDAK